MKTLLPLATIIVVVVFLLRPSQSPTPQGQSQAQSQAQSSASPPPQESAIPTPAPTFLEPLESGDNRPHQIVRVAQNRAGHDPQAVLAWAAALEDESERQSAIHSACLEIAQFNPARAVQTLEKLDPAADSRILEDLTQLWSAADSASAADWVLARTAGADRDRLLARVAYVIAEHDPDRAAHLLINHTLPGEAQTEGAIAIIHRWAIIDSTSAKRWVGQFPAGPLRDRAQNELAGVAKYTEALNPSR